MRPSTLTRFRHYVFGRLKLDRYLDAPGDGRRRPQIPARDLLWSLLMGRVLRDSSHHAIEALVRSPARRALGVIRRLAETMFRNG